MHHFGLRFSWFSTAAFHSCQLRRARYGFANMVVGSTLCTYDIALQYFHTNGLRNLKSARVFLASGNMRP